MKINDVVAVPVHGGFFYDDLAAIRKGAAKDHQWYEGEEPQVCLAGRAQSTQ